MVFNEHGYRSEKILKKKKKILILGLKYTTIPYIKNNKDIWAMKLQELLKKKKKLPNFKCKFKLWYLK